MKADSLRCWAEISRSALLHNIRVARRQVGDAVEILAVVKANGYGHGLTETARILAPVADLFGVANLEEATEARRVVTQPIMILGPALPGEREEIGKRGFIASVSSYDEARAFESAAPCGRIAVNLVIDTGMGRMGASRDGALAELTQISTLQRVRLHSISTHLPVADEDGELTREQLQDFAALVRQIRRSIPGDYKAHALLSAGILAHADHRFDLVRAGLMLYGASPLPRFQEQLVPVMTLKSRVVLLRDVAAGTAVSYGRTFVTSRPSKLATIGAGYADGYPRALSNRGAAVLIGGVRCPLLGRVTMDLIIVDVTELPQVAIGDEVVLFGQQGRSEIPARELAELAGTIPWDIFTGIGSRVRRVYL